MYLAQNKQQQFTVVDFRPGGDMGQEHGRPASEIIVKGYRKTLIWPMRYVAPDDRSCKKLEDVLVGLGAADTPWQEISDPLKHLAMTEKPPAPNRSARPPFLKARRRSCWLRRPDAKRQAVQRRIRTRSLKTSKPLTSGLRKNAMNMRNLSIFIPSFSVFCIRRPAKTMSLPVWTECGCSGAMILISRP